MECYCKQCQKNFATQEALEQHNQAKHARKEKRQEFKIGKMHVGIAVLVLIALAGYSFYTTLNTPGEYDGFVQCLSDKGAIFYGAFWCPSCAEQKALFGKSYRLAKYVECSTSDRTTQTQECIQKNIQRYPTWEFADATRETGVLSLERLAQKTGCELKKDGS